MKNYEINIKIAKYMGCTFESKKNGNLILVHGLLSFVPDWRRKQGVAICGTPYMSTNNLRFHYDWNWLMPVVTKIQKTPDCLIASDNDDKRFAFMLFTLSIVTPIDVVYQFVSNYIDWHNKQL